MASTRMVQVALFGDVLPADPKQTSLLDFITTRRTDMDQRTNAARELKEQRAHAETHTRENSYWEKDIEGIPLARVCDACRGRVLRGFRPEVLDDEQREAAGLSSPSESYVSRAREHGESIDDP